MVPRVRPTSIVPSSDFPTARVPSNPPAKASPILVLIDDLLVLERIDNVRLDVIGTAGTGSDGWTMGEHDNTIANEVRF